MATSKRRPRRSTRPKVGRGPTEPKPVPNGDGAAEVPQAPASPDGDRSAEDVVERDHPIG